MSHKYARKHKRSMTSRGFRRCRCRSGIASRRGPGRTKS